MYETKVLTTQEEIEKAASMKSSSIEQNQYLRQAIQDGQIKLEDCYILKCNHEVVSRAIIIDGCQLGLYTLENISQKYANEFLANVLRRYPNRKFTMDLYSDKKNYKIVYSSLLANGFRDISHRESYIIKVLPVYNDSKLSFKSIGSADEKFLVDLFTHVAKDNKDRIIFKQIKEKGLYYGSRELFLELKKIDFTRELWMIAYYNDKPIGFIIVQKFTDNDAAVGYIGVIPEYRGNHFSCDLLFKAINLAYQFKFKKLIADIDVENYPMRNNLINCGFMLDCTETSFIYNEEKFPLKHQ